MSNVALVGFGSVGDVHPLLAIGRDLQRLGHRVVVLTNPQHAGTVARASLAFEPVGTIEEYERTMAHPKLWDPIDGLGVLWRYLLRGALKPTYAVLERLARQDRWTVVASPVAMGARVAQEVLGLPLITVYTGATMLRTASAPMTLAAWRVPRLVPRAAIGLTWKLLDICKLQPLVLPALNDLRGSLGLRPLRKSVFGEWMHSPTAGVALFPSWFAPAPADWPVQVRQSGFTLYDADARDGLSAGLSSFLESGPPPVVFTRGTGAEGSREFHAAAAAACARADLRGIVLDPALPAGTESPSPAVHVARYAPFPLLLPRAAALVHHGGVGSCAQALHAGIPQVLLPRAYDQFDNAMRISSLGVGSSLAHRDLHHMGPELRRLLSCPDVLRACAKWAPRASGTQALDTVAAVVRELA